MHGEAPAMSTPNYCLLYQSLLVNINTYMRVYRRIEYMSDRSINFSCCYVRRICNIIIRVVSCLKMYQLLHTRLKHIVSLIQNLQNLIYQIQFLNFYFTFLTLDFQVVFLIFLILIVPSINIFYKLSFFLILFFIIHVLCILHILHLIIHNFNLKYVFKA